MKVERGFINLSRCKVELSKSESDSNGGVSIIMIYSTFLILQ